jgi:hypothetical protein
VLSLRWIRWQPDGVWLARLSPTDRRSEEKKNRETEQVFAEFVDGHRNPPDGQVDDAAARRGQLVSPFDCVTLLPPPKNRLEGRQNH